MCHFPKQSIPCGIACFVPYIYIVWLFLTEFKVFFWELIAKRRLLIQGYYSNAIFIILGNQAIQGSWV